MKTRIGDLVYIQSYKHDGSLHRTWVKGFVVEETKEYIAAITDKAWVIEADKRKWLTREPAVCFFYKKEWFNIIAMIRKAGIYFYCNIASPSIYDGEAIKNIDYDLDIKFYPNGYYEILDRNEYDAHKKIMSYPKEIDILSKSAINELIRIHKKRKIPFDPEKVDELYQKYLDF